MRCQPSGYGANPYGSPYSAYGAPAPLLPAPASGEPVFGVGGTFWNPTPEAMMRTLGPAPLSTPYGSGYGSAPTPSYGASPYGAYPPFAAPASSTDAMLDARLAEQRCKDAERREALLKERVAVLEQQVHQPAQQGTATFTLLSPRRRMSDQSSFLFWRVPVC